MMEGIEFKRRKRDSVFVNLDGFGFNDKNDYIEVTSWTNGEGYDINIGTNHGNQNFTLSYSELEALKMCVDILDKRNVKITGE